jgi:hypothetical protein
MTHDELSRQLEGLWHDSYKAPGYMALRAVVKLHKPNQVQEAVWCTECSKRFENSGWYEPYPCPTIRAIEEQLK